MFGNCINSGSLPSFLYTLLLEPRLVKSMLVFMDDLSNATFGGSGWIGDDTIIISGPQYTVGMGIPGNTTIVPALSLLSDQ